jgi:hypothetical protein
MLAANLAVCFLAPIVVFVRAFSWGQKRSWTDYPNFNGLVTAVVAAGLWISVSWTIADQPELRALLPITDVVFATRRDTNYALWLGMTNLGLAAIGAGILLTVVAWLLQMLRWLFIPRRRW